MNAYCKMCAHLLGVTRPQAMRANTKCQKCGTPYNGDTDTVLCGCDRHFLAMKDSNIVRYKDRWWALRCLFVKVDKRMPKIIQKIEGMEKEIKRGRKMRLKFIRMKNFVKKLPCSGCGHKVGNRFTQFGEKVLCGSCGNELKRSVVL